MNNAKYTIRIGKYDHKLGPYCYFSKSDEICLFTDKPCDTFSCNLIRDPLLSKETKEFFESNDQKFNSLTIPVRRPQMRGQIERYLIIIKLVPDRGKLPPEILNNIVEDFQKIFKNDVYDPTKEEFYEFVRKWEQILNSNIIFTSVVIQTQFIRNSLNVIAGYLQIIESNPQLDQSTKEYIKQTLNELFELIHVFEKPSD